MAGSLMYSLIKDRVLYDVSTGTEFLMLYMSNNLYSLNTSKYCHAKSVQISLGEGEPNLFRFIFRRKVYIKVFISPNGLCALP